MEERIKQNADRLLNAIKPLLRDLNDDELLILKSEISRIIRHTVEDTGSFINTVLFNELVKAKHSEG